MVLVKGNFKLFSTFFVRFAVMCDVRRGAMEMGLLQKLNCSPLSRQRNYEQRVHSTAVLWQLRILHTASMG